MATIIDYASITDADFATHVMSLRCLPMILLPLMPPFDADATMPPICHALRLSRHALLLFHAELPHIRRRLFAIRCFLRYYASRHTLLMLRVIATPLIFTPFTLATPRSARCLLCCCRQRYARQRRHVAMMMLPRALLPRRYSVDAHSHAYAMARLQDFAAKRERRNEIVMLRRRWLAAISAICRYTAVTPLLRCRRLFFCRRCFRLFDAARRHACLRFSLRRHMPACFIVFASRHYAFSPPLLRDAMERATAPCHAAVATPACRAIYADIYALFYI